MLDEVGATGWELPSAHEFLIAKARLLEAGRSPRFAGFPEAIRAYLSYQYDPAEGERSRELDHDLNTLVAKLGETLAEQGEDSLPDEDAARQALAAVPSDSAQKIPLLGLVLGRMEIRDQLRQLPPRLSDALQGLDALVSHDPAWKSQTGPEVDAALMHLGRPECPLPDMDLLLDLSRRWDDSRLLTTALDRLESDDPAYEQSLTGLWNEFFRNREPEARRRLPDDTSAWIGRLAISVPDLSLSGVKQLEELSGRGNAKAKFFLIDHYLKPGTGASPSLDDLRSWRALAEEAASGGETGALVQLGTIHWRLADADADSPDPNPSLAAAREHLRKAIRECHRQTDRDTATVLLAGLLSEMGTDGSAERREMAEVCFQAGVILSHTDLPLAIRNWNKAKQADPNSTRDWLRAQLEAAERSGDAETAEALKNWWDPTD